MPKYIKSHSNYRLATKHQNVNGGKISERDITTIGGVSPFAAGQTTIHSSGNFIIAINDSTGPSRHIKKKGWMNNDESGATWTNEVLANQSSDVNASVESKIVLKNDYMDFRTFACYGSLADLVQNSVGDILEKFPYEIYTDEGNADYKEYQIKGSLDAVELTAEGKVSGKGMETYTYDEPPKTINVADYIDVTASGDTEAFVEALNKVKTSNSVLYIPNGTYCITRPINLDHKEIKVIGQSRVGVKLYGYSRNDQAHEGTTEYCFILNNSNIEIANIAFYKFTSGAILTHSSEYSAHNNRYAGISGVVEDFQTITDDNEQSTVTEDIVNMYIKKPESTAINIHRDLSNLQNAEYVSGKWYEISNPGGINMHAVNVEECENVNPLKFFANGSYLNYGLIFDQYEPAPVDGYDFEWESNLNCYSVSGTSTNLDVNPIDENYFALYFNSATTFNKIDGIQVINKPYTAKKGQTVYVRRIDNKYQVFETYCPQAGDFVADITLTPTSGCVVWTEPINIKAYRDNNLNVTYLVQEKDFRIHIRPKQSLSYYDNFKDSLNLFQKTLLGDFSGVKNVSRFEVMSEGEYGYTKKVQTFTFPTDHGDWNPGGDGLDMVNYIRTLSNIALMYDENFSDNIYRSMTHEAIKNLDWTKGFNGNDTKDGDNHYIQTGEKMKSVLRIMGFFFDQEKAYTDCIGNVNTLTYNNRSNLSDYFITDKLNLDGWVVRNIATYTLHEYDDVNKEVYEEEFTETNQKKNYYKRVFVENTNDILTPYLSVETPTYWAYNAETQKFEENVLNGSLPSCSTALRVYESDNEYTFADINNEFMKRLAINSKYLLRKKGTVDGVEEVLSLLGFRSKRWYGALNDNVRHKYINKQGTLIPYDYEINEYTAFAAPLLESWDVEHNMYRIDYLNSCKTIAYETDDFMNGIYVAYQGLPVAYRDCTDLYLTPSGKTTNNPNKAVKDAEGKPVKARYLYPYFDRNGIYDGGLYYQMRGGWLNYAPYSFDSNSNVIPNEEMNTYKETMRDVRQANNLQSLIDTPQAFLNEGTVMYVHDLSRNMAIIDGHTYDLIPENGENGVNYYFTLEVKDGGVWLGDKLYENFLSVSNPSGNDGIVNYCIPALQEGSIIKVYYDTQYEDKFYIKGYSSISYFHTEWENGLSYSRECDSSEPDAYEVFENELFPDTMIAFINGSYHEDYNNYSHYFILTNVNYYDVIGEDGWRQLSVYEPDYLRIDPIQDDFEGNNPHCGNGGYDSGYAYMEAFKRLFGYALDNEYFNEDNFKSLTDMYAELSKYGFSGITEQDMDSYFGKLRVDEKVHGMLDRIGEFDVDGLNVSGDTNYEYRVKYYDQVNGLTNEKDAIYLKYDVNNSRSLYYSNGYKNTISSLKGSADSVTSQIMNTKVIEINFYIGVSTTLYKKYLQEKIKYIQDKIMPYVEQMLPSTAIPVIHFVATPFIFDEGNDIPKGFWHNEYFLTPDGIWPEDVSNVTLGTNNLSSMTQTEDDRLYSLAEDTTLSGKTYMIYTFMPEETDYYTINFTFDSGSSTVNFSGLTLLDYEYTIKRVTGGPYYTTEKDISPRFGEPPIGSDGKKHYVFQNVYLVKDTHYKIALRYAQKSNQSMKVLNGVLRINKGYVD